MSSTTVMTVWCFAIDANEPLGELFQVSVESDSQVCTLKEKIKEKSPFTFKDADPSQLTVWRCLGGTTSLHGASQEKIAQLFSNQEVENLDPRTFIAELGLTKADALLVRRPSTRVRKSSSELQASSNKRMRLPEHSSDGHSSVGTQSEADSMDVSDVTRGTELQTPSSETALDNAIERAKAVLHEYSHSLVLAATTDPQIDASNAFFVDGLGVLYDINDHIKVRVGKLFQSGKSKVLFNTSGSGKTRLLVEGLCQHWGFYFTTDTEPILGSRDFSRSITAISQTPKSVVNLPSSPTRREGPLERNRTIAANVFTILLLAHFLVFEAFLKAGANVPAADLRRRWTYLQLMPSVLQSHFSGAEDIFSEVYISLEELRASDDRLLCIHSRKRCVEYRKTTSQDPRVSTSSMFMILDQAQVLTKMYSGAFYADKDSNSAGCSLLQDFCVAFRFGQKNTVILSGTGFSLTEVSISMASSIGVADYVFTDLGAFVTQESQEKYIKRHVVLDKDTEEEVLRRAWRWLRGRHRFTGGFVHLLRCCGTKNASALLSHYVQSLSGYMPLDGSGEGITLEQRARLSSIQSISRQLRKLDEHEVLRDRVADAIANFVLRHKPQIFKDSDATTIEFGVSRYTTVGEEIHQHKTLTIDEPLIIASALERYSDSAVSMEEKLHGAICSLPIGPNRGYAIESIGMYVLAQLLDGTKSLREISTFRTKSVNIRQGPAHLIAIDQINPLHYSIVNKPWQYPLGLCFEASSPSQHKEWFRGMGVPFCFPDPRSGHDIGFFVLVDNQVIFIMVQLKSYSTDLSKATTKQGLRSLDLSNCYKDKNGKVYTPGKSARQLMLETVKQLNIPCLGVLTSFPSNPHVQAIHENTLEHFALFNLSQAKGELGKALERIKSGQFPNLEDFNLPEWQVDD